MNNEYFADMTVEEYEEYFADRIETLNSMVKDKGFVFTLNYAYDGVRLCKRRIGSSGESDLSCRFFYDQDEYETSNYEAFKDMLNTLINVLMAVKE